MDGRSPRTDLSLVYLPHLDYDLQKFAPEDHRIALALRAIDQVVGDLIDYEKAFGSQSVRIRNHQDKQSHFPQSHFSANGWLN